MIAVSQSNIAAPTPDFSGVEFATSADGLSVDRPSSFIGWRSPGGWTMINIRASKPLAKQSSPGERSSGIWNV